jgi:hypothetical protein
MRVREWYSWHFPELVKIVNDNYQYAQVGGAVRGRGGTGAGMWGGRGRGGTGAGVWCGTGAGRYRCRCVVRRRGHYRCSTRGMAALQGRSGRCGGGVPRLCREDDWCLAG